MSLLLICGVFFTALVLRKIFLLLYVLGAGGNAGIGKAAALEFAKMGARVVIASRKLKKSEKARDEIIEESENENVISVVLMLSPKQGTITIEAAP